jgi:hypothetical protein
MYIHAPQAIRIMRQAARTRTEQYSAGIRIKHFPGQLHIRRQFFNRNNPHGTLLLFRRQIGHPPAETQPMHILYNVRHLNSFTFQISIIQ